MTWYDEITESYVNLRKRISHIDCSLEYVHEQFVYNDYDILWEKLIVMFSAPQGSSLLQTEFWYIILPCVKVKYCSFEECWIEPCGYIMEGTECDSDFITVTP